MNTHTKKHTEGAFGLFVGSMIFALLASPLSAQNTFWALDEEDDNRIWAWSDYASDTSAVDHGRLQYNDGSGWEFFGSLQIEAFALTNGNIGYMLDEDDGLYSYDFGNITAGSGNTYQATTINADINIGGEALAYNRFDGMLYLASVVGSASSSDTNADALYQINPATGATTLVGTMSGLGEVLGYTDGLEFNHTTGALYAIDSNDDHLYQINPGTGAIIAVLDNDTHGGIDSDADIESLAWDAATNRLIGVDNDNDKIVHLTFQNGNNVELSNYRSHLGSDKDFEGTGIIAGVPEPSVTALFGIAGMVLIFRRRTN
ncbi:MAG: PEP-CTERM sorting domain-containing protein [Akkermansiaceae bacterium]